MSVLRVNPGQEKTVALLVAALAAAIAVTVFRTHPAASPKVPAAKADQQVAEVSISVTAGRRRSGPTRNPFVSLDVFRAASDGTGAVSPAPGSEGRRPGLWQIGGDSRSGPISPLPTLEIRPIGDAPPKGMNGSAGKNEADSARPKFALRATIKGGNGLAGVIRIGDSTVKVVEVGDVLDSGFEVKDLQPGRAVLTDGRDTIIAKQMPL